MAEGGIWEVDQGDAAHPRFVRELGILFRRGLQLQHQRTARHDPGACETRRTPWSAHAVSMPSCYVSTMPLWTQRDWRKRGGVGRRLRRRNKLLLRRWQHKHCATEIARIAKSVRSLSSFTHKWSYARKASTQ